MKQKIFNYVKPKINKKNNQNWFEKNQGLITFYGYLSTTIISITALLYSVSFSNKTLIEIYKQNELSKKQFGYVLKKDSSSEVLSKQQFVHQDSLNKHQDSINRIQLKNFILQTSIQQKEFKNSEKQIVEQKIENRPLISVQNLDVDTLPVGNKFKLKFTIKNLGKRNFSLKNFYVIALNKITGVSTAVPAHNSHYLIPINFEFMVDMDLDKNWFYNNNTNYLIKIFYEDDALYNGKTSDKKIEDFYFSIINMKPFQISIIELAEKERIKKEFLLLEKISKSKFN